MRFPGGINVDEELLGGVVALWPWWVGLAMSETFNNEREKESERQPSPTEPTVSVGFSPFLFVLVVW